MSLLGCAEMWNIHNHKVNECIFAFNFPFPTLSFLSNSSKKSLTELWVSYTHAGLMEDPPLQLTPVWSQAIPHCWRAETYEIIIISPLLQLMADEATTLFSGSASNVAFSVLPLLKPCSLICMLVFNFFCQSPWLKRTTKEARFMWFCFKWLLIS